MNLTPQQQAFFDRLDETPQRRAGGFIVGFGQAEFRSRPRFPRLELRRRRLAELEMDRRSAWLEMTGRLLEMEERL